MKKNILSITFIFVSIIAFSQASVSIGLKGGLNRSGGFSDVDNLNSINSYHVGVYGLIKISKIGIQPEILFSKQGAELSSANNFVREVDLSYVTVPVMIKFYLPLGINIQAGPQFGFLVNDIITDDTTVALEENFKKTDINGAVGLGWDLPFGLQISGRYLIGLSDIATSPDYDFRSSTLQIAIGYSFFKLGN